MNGSWLERLQWWLCRKFGHKPRFDQYGNEICKRCRKLISTPYSRSKEYG